MADIIKVFDVEINTSSVNEFRKSLKEARAAMNEAEIGTTEFAQGVRDLEVAENKLRNALKLGTTEVAKAPDSYNALTRTMSELKAQWRATADEAERDTLGKQIAGINQRLKDMDASVGDYFRNVGDYSNQIAKGLKDTTDALDHFLPGIGQLGTAVFDVVGACEALAPLFPFIVKGVKSFVASLHGVKAAIAATGLGLFVVALGSVVAYWDEISAKLKDLSPWHKAEAGVKALREEHETLKEEIEGSNTALERQITLLQAQGAKAAEIAEVRLNAAKEQLANLKKVQQEADTMVAIYSEQAFAGKALEEAKTIAQEAATAVAEQADKVKDLETQLKAAKIAATRDAEIEATRIAEEEAEKRRNIAENNAKAENDLIKMRQGNRPKDYENDLLTLEENYRLELAALQQRINDEYIAEATGNAMKLELERKFQQDKEALRKEYGVREREEQVNVLSESITLQTDANKLLAKGMEGINKIQEKYHNENKKRKEEEKAREKAVADAKVQYAEIGVQAMQSAAQLIGEQTAAGKALMVASTLMSTYMSATEAYKAMAGIPYVGPALGIAAAAAAVASGLANVKQIMSVDASGKSTPSIPSSASATVSAPAIVQEVPVMRTLTSATEEERLNKMASDQRVYLVYSDVEEAAQTVQVQQSESSF